MLAEMFTQKSGTLDLFRQIYGGKLTATGKAVNVSTAIEVAAVFACNRVIGNGMAQVPLKLMRESADGKTRLPAKDHPLYNKLGFKPNRWQTSFEYRQTVSWHVELCGNHFSFINRLGGKVLELYPFEPGMVKVVREDNGDMSYEVTAQNGSKQIFPSSAIWHMRGPSWNSWYGMEIVKLAREAIGLSMAIEEQQGAMQKNGVRSSGTYSVEGTLKDDQFKALSAWINQNLGGSENSGKAMVLDRAAKWLPTSQTGIDAQTLETRNHQVEEICRFFGVMPILAGYSDKAATYASAVEMFLAHVRNCLSPRWEAYEQSLNAALLTERERNEGLYFSFVEEGMLRGSVKDTHAMILADVNGGIITANEGRKLLDMNPDADSESDKLRIPANIVGAVPDAKPQGATP